MRHLLGVVELVGYIFAVDDGDVWILGVRFVDEGYGCFVVFCGHVWKDSGVGRALKESRICCISLQMQWRSIGASGSGRMKLFGRRGCDKIAWHVISFQDFQILWSGFFPARNGSERENHCKNIRSDSFHGRLSVAA